ncbi:MAG: hypothetical protein KAR65_01790 [Anaerolineales bacterium]|nr:hypothetical protein [Anaerolineales bacterium]MCK5634548.1 hypothetical protein [Anaerolineales bacterium]
MRRKGQILIIVAVLIPVSLLLLAVAVDAGRLFIERGRMKRAAQAAADAGISVVAEEMVTLAVARQTTMASTPSPTPPGVMTATPFPGDVIAWLHDDDRATLVSDTVFGIVATEVFDYAKRNGFDVANPDTLAISITYPQPGYAPDNASIPVLRLLVSIRQRATILLAGLLSDQWVDLAIEGQSEIPQR